MLQPPHYFPVVINTPLRERRIGVGTMSAQAKQKGIKLDGTYTGKALAAVRRDARSGRLRDKTVLFWNTFNSRDFSDEISGLDYHELPRPFHRYFEQEVQPLDRD